MNQKIVIAGSSGNIGRKLIKILDDKKTDLTEISSSVVNLLDEKKIEDFLINQKSIDVLIFLVGLAHKKGSGKDYNEFNQVNYITLKNFLNACLKNNCKPRKIIYTSSISVYGESLKNKFFYEDSILNPKSPYAKTKVNSEKFLINNYKNESFVLRLSPVYSNEFLLNIQRRIHLSKFSYQIGKGDALLSLCNIENIVMVVNAIIREKIPIGIYNLSDSYNYSYKDLLERFSTSIVIKIPKIFIRFSMLVGIVLKNRFIIDNSIKLISDNLYPSKKLNEFIKLDKNIWN